MRELPRHVRSLVWYVEARRCDSAGAWASEDAASMGSAVLVELAPRERPGAARRYLLTCAHVVRRGTESGGWWGAPYEEILCWPSGQGYTRTHARMRRCGEHADIASARISPLSPCGGEPGELPPELRQSAQDWVLLEIDDAQFQSQGTALVWQEADTEADLYVVGYPAGAGCTPRVEGGHYWKSGSLVTNIASGPFRIEGTPNGGMLQLSGDETRPGMSGGAIFDTRGALVALHRSADDEALRRDAIAITHIRDQLATRRQVEPTVPRIAADQKRRWVIGGIAVAALAALATTVGSLWPGPPPDCRLRIDVTTAAAGKLARAFDALRADGYTESVVLQGDGAASLTLTQLGAQERWSFGLRYDESESPSVALTGCPAAPHRYDLEENAHVDLAPQ